MTMSIPKVFRFISVGESVRVCMYMSLSKSPVHKHRFHHESSSRRSSGSSSSGGSSDDGDSNSKQQTAVNTSQDVGWCDYGVGFGMYGKNAQATKTPTQTHTGAHGHKLLHPCALPFPPCLPANGGEGKGKEIKTQQQERLQVKYDIKDCSIIVGNKQMKEIQQQ